MSGFPIRTPWDHSLVDSSPRPIAASHVLHRLLVPRHPPFALNNLTYRKQDARVHCAILNQQPTHNPTAPHQPPGTQPTKADRLSDTVCETRPCLDSSEKTTEVVPSGPNRVLIIPPSRTDPHLSCKTPKGFVYSA